MSVHKTKYGTFEVRWRDIDGRQRSRTRKTERAAKELDAAVSTDTMRGLPTVKPKSVTVAEQAQRWLDGAHNLDASTLRIYRESLANILPVLGATPLDRLDADAINAYLAGRRNAVAPSSVHREYRALRRLLRVAVAQGRIPASPITREAVPSPAVPEEEMTFLTEHQLERLAATIDARYRTLVLVAGYGGLRWGELAGLRGMDVDVVGQRVRVSGQMSKDGKAWKPETKTKRRRWVSLPASVVAELDVRDGYIWTQPAGGPLVHTKFRARFFVPAAVRCSLATLVCDLATRETHYEGLRIHDLRHTAAALAIKAGAKPKELQEMLGHTLISTTYDRYGHLFPEAQADLAARLDDLRAGTRKLRAV